MRYRDSHVDPSKSRQGWQNARAFSLIELFVVIGVVMVLVGLVLPSISGSMGAARGARGLAGVQQDAALVAMYCESSREVLPFSGYTNPVTASTHWPEPLIRLGLLDSVRAADPSGYARFGRLNIVMTLAAVYDSKFMVPGNTVVQREARKAIPVRVHEIAFPSSKGLFAPITVDNGRTSSPWCCFASDHAGPVAWFDGSATSELWASLLPGGRLYIENGIGTPVSSTWGGTQGRDRHFGE